MIGRDRTITYAEIVKEVADEPDYDRVFAAVQRLSFSVTLSLSKGVAA